MVSIFLVGLWVKQERRDGEATVKKASGICKKVHSLLPINGSGKGDGEGHHLLQENAYKVKDPSTYEVTAVFSIK